MKLIGKTKEGRYKRFQMDKKKLDKNAWAKNKEWMKTLNERKGTVSEKKKTKQF